VLVDGDGGALGVVLAAANVNDHLLLRETIEAIVIERPGANGGGAAASVPGCGLR